jgi:hypothetical protein
MFLNPEVAAGSLNETKAKKRKIPYRMAVMDYRCINRAVAMGKTGGYEVFNPDLRCMRKCRLAIGIASWVAA